MQLLNFKQYLNCWGNTKIWDKQKWDVYDIVGANCYMAAGWTSIWKYRSQNSGKVLVAQNPFSVGDWEGVFFFLTLRLLFVPECENFFRAGQTHFSHCCHASKPHNLWFQINIFLSHVLSHVCLTGGTNGMIFTWSKNRNEILWWIWKHCYL